ncbi:tetratricopeptide repeat protein [Streptomyces sp. 3MP-14]|uniref:Tetratricopeptide repeat protein n=1 Tax=Streptomyces mimosae TaxID=2586635 RepID=A0A5N5ZUT7_9ACTN|nr:MULTISPECIES: tetratricopeptide repeat protein [Streptomyces]KAB8159549.1 tetratricopeptide repeat protein [Streptomyces mimosae]KAB8172827.1 tetratricopeptide repeat protein [Streptomyces sp. 3MP-14]
MEFRIRLLGPVELLLDDRPSALPSPQDSLVLAALAWDVGRMVSIETLIERVWDFPPERARNNLHVHIARIRKAFRQCPGPTAPSIHTRSHAYTLDAPPHSVDVHHYLDLTARARAHADQGQPREAEARLEEAAALWRGEPLTGLTSSWANDVRETLGQRRLYVALTRAGIALQLRHHGDAIAELWTLSNQHPTDEHLVEHLALGLYSAGRVSDAGDEVERVRRRLRNEQGVDLGPRLRLVRQAIANRTLPEELLVALGYTPAAGPAVVRRPPGPDDLPADIDYLGRQGEVRAILAELDRRRSGDVQGPAMVGIDGMAGAGKTVLAVHIAHRLKEHYPDGRLMIDLRGHDRTQAPLSTAHVLTELLRRLGKVPKDEDQLVTVWRTVLARRRVLLLLDNAAGPEQVLPLLPGATNSLVIVTSRHRLATIPGLHAHSLDALSEGEAVALFQDRIRGRAADPSEIARIARLTGCLPLALDIVAARFLTRPSWSIEELTSRLSHGRDILHEIRDGTRAVAAAFELSYQALSESGQHIFRHLGLLVGREFGPHAVAALTGYTLGDVESELDSLYYAHLTGESPSGRFALHDLLREFAQVLARSELPPEVSRAAFDRLADAYVTAADQADRLAYPHRVRIEVDAAPPVELTGWLDPSEPERWFRAEIENLLALLRHLDDTGDRHRSALLSHVLAGFLDADGRHSQSGAAQLRAAAAYWSEQNAPRAQARALLDLSSATARTGHYAESLTTARRALRLAEQHADRDALLEALQRMAITHHETGRHQEALPLMRRLIPLRQRHSDLRQRTRAINLLGAIQLNAGELGAALTTFREAFNGARSAGDARGQYMALSNISLIQRKRNSHDEAIASLRQALEISENGGRLDERMVLKVNLADALQKAGDASSALSLYQEALPVFRSLEEQHKESAALIGIGRALTALGRPVEAIPHHHAALDLARSLDAGVEEARALRELGHAEALAGRHEEAAGHLHQSLKVARELKLGFVEVETREVLAELHESRGEADRAAHLRAGTRALMRQLGAETS